MRKSGILMHISSLPSGSGIGTLGAEAFTFVNFLAETAQSYWQTLPLVPTGISNSPYQSASCFAFNELFISPESLESDGLLSSVEYKAGVVSAGKKVDFSDLRPRRREMLRKAYGRFPKGDAEFISFLADGSHKNYGLFMALKDAHNQKAWSEWQPQFRLRDPSALEDFYSQNKDAVDFYQWTQFVFLRQWHKLKAYANSKGIRLIGDVPIYLDYDSVEVWEQPKLMQLDEGLKPKIVAGVPPDYFSEKGQLWGNPVYDWAEMKKNGYEWWLERLRRAGEIFDLVRIDHFRGFADYYGIAYGSKDAMVGKWYDGAGMDLFDRVKELNMGIIAEDLGFLSDTAKKFVQDAGYPGIKVLQFAFDQNPQNEYLPHLYTENCAAYTGTHDNDTLVGWLKKRSREELAYITNVLGIRSGVSTRELCRSLIYSLLNSKADIVIIPIQDYLGEGSSSRMNMPGTVKSSNWAYIAGDYNTDKVKKFIASCRKP